jgi:SAM-dependent methyltransferase
MMKNLEYNQYLQCPKCKGDLSFEEKKVICFACDKEYPYLDGKYLTFSTFPNDWEQLTESQYQELFRELKDLPWNEALQKIMLKYWGKYLADYNTSPERYTFVDTFLGKLSNDLTVLDIGSGFGNTSFALAKKFKKVIAVDTPNNIIRWLNAVKEKDNLSNLEAVGIENLDFSGLPFKDNTFDIILFSMTFQWTGSFNEKESPNKIQMKVIKQIFRKLKEGGLLVFLDMNRYKYSYFLGEVDSSGVKYASILPRKIANIFSYFYKKFLIKNPERNYQYINKVSLQHNSYRNYKHTYKNLESIFKKSGFKKTYSVIALPNIKFQELFLPLQNKKKAEEKYGQWFQKQILPTLNGHFLSKLFFNCALKFGFSRFLADGYLIFAIK